MTKLSDIEQQQAIAKIIELGKERKYLTYDQIYDLLPISDPEDFDGIVNMLRNMNYEVFEHQPSDVELALLATTEETPDDEIEVGYMLTSLQTEAGRTSDPVRMYMREMGTVELLTREGEIKIAKRIEEGTYQVLHALALYPEA